ncbi:MAG: Hsp20/alpha crystallin family protein [Candidatus Pacebacteria bacterium]|nr:Hsp20/alpha crystallin family protein [Candidatus Paceibacterota bacterium]
MMKQKKSFLDKIVGSEEGYPDTEVQSESQIKDAIAIQDKDEQVNRETEMENNWGNDEEGVEEEGQLAIDVYQDDDYVVIRSIVGGIRPEDLDLSVTSDMVTIRGSREKAEEVAEENYYYQECFWGSFSRSVILPCDIMIDKVEASMKNGILTIKMPKVEKNSATKIQVRGE